MVFALKKKSFFFKIVIIGYRNKNQRRNRRLNNLKKLEKKEKRKNKTKQTNKKGMSLKIGKIDLALL